MATVTTKLITPTPLYKRLVLVEGKEVGVIVETHRTMHLGRTYGAEYMFRPHAKRPPKFGKTIKEVVGKIEAAGTFKGR